MTYPDPTILLQQQNANRLLEVRRSPRSLLSLIILFFILVAFAFVSSELFIRVKIIADIFSFLDPRYFALLPGFLFLEILRKYHNDLYIFGAHRLTHLRGRFSLSYHVPVVKYGDIRAINVMQDFWGRIFNYGDVIIGTAAHQGNELVISGVKDPEKLAYLIDSLRDFSIRENSS
jgi:hypothetical protein